MDELSKSYRDASRELVYYPSTLGSQYYPGNDKYYENLHMTKEEKQKYIGMRVYAGGRMKGYYGIVVDIIPDEDGYSEDWFIVQEDNNPSHFERWGKEELQKVIITTALVPLD